MAVNEGRKGYEETKLRWIPDEWNVLSISQLSVNGTQNGLYKTKEFYGDGYEMVHMPDIFSSRILVEGGMKKVLLSENELSKYQLYEGDLIFARRSLVLEGVGKCCLIGKLKKPVAFESSIIRVTLKNDLIFPMFALHYLESYRGKFEMLRFARQVAVSGIAGSDIQKYVFPLPPLTEQKKIAQILSTWDKAIELTEKLIQAKKRLKKGLMQQLLTGKKRFGEFKNENWNIFKLKEKVDKFIVPMRDKPKTFKGTIPWCRIEDFEGKYLSGSKSNQCVDQETIKEMRLKVYPVGTVLCSCSANLGICAITKVPLITNQTFIGLFPNKYLNEEFLYYQLTFNSVNLNKLSTGTTISYLSREEFENFSIKIPSLAEQKKIASVLSACDKELKLLNKKLEALKQQKKGLMQKLLTGQVRVNHCLNQD
ncbi:MAG: hypothetical protein GY749_01285 [Desulfobacteraceae bacterium]|nr:hypothetical protein [Desulfobacteraceae bacterium]